MVTQKEIDNVTPDQIAGAIMEMFNTLLFLDGPELGGFQENIQSAIDRFDKPALRTKLRQLLYDRG